MTSTQKRIRCFWAAIILLGSAPAAFPGTIAVSGTITQSTEDGTGPAINNPGLNTINDGDSFSVQLFFLGEITSPGTYPLSDNTLAFYSGAASETAFAVVSVAVVPSGDQDEFYLLGCLTTGADCFQGNQLTLAFLIPAGDLNSISPVTPIQGLLGMDLLEDDGTTDIQGALSNYSYVLNSQNGQSGAAPETSSIYLVAIGLAMTLGGRAGRRHLARKQEKKR